MELLVLRGFNKVDMNTSDNYNKGAGLLGALKGGGLSKSGAARHGHSKGMERSARGGRTSPPLEVAIKITYAPLFSRATFIK